MRAVRQSCDIVQYISPVVKCRWQILFYIRLVDLHGFDLFFTVGYPDNVLVDFVEFLVSVIVGVDRCGKVGTKLFQVVVVDDNMPRQIPYPLPDFLR